MALSKTATSRQKIIIGGLAGALGLCIMAFGLGLLLSAGDPRSPPLWIVSGIGAMFFLIGAGVFVQAVVRPRDNGALGTEAPSWLRAFQYAAVTSIFGCFAVITSWVAFWPGERPFSGSIVVFGIGITAILGRVAFGFAAIIMWICTLLLVAGGVGVLWQRTRDGQAGGMD
jgi:hypothetical protein